MTIDVMSVPLLVGAVSFLMLCLAAEAGNMLRTKTSPLQEDERDDCDCVLGAVLTLLALIVGCSFSMAVTCYGQRKTYEEEEANAIGTEYGRVGLLHQSDGENLHSLLKKYVDERVWFYETRNRAQLARINQETADLQNQLWSAVRAAAATPPTAAGALVLSGMNDVLNSQGYTQAAWWTAFRPELG